MKIGQKLRNFLLMVKFWTCLIFFTHTLSEERTNLNQKVQESEEKLAKLQNSVKTSLTPCLASLDDLKCDLKTFKTKIQADQQEFLAKMCGGLTDDIVKEVLKMNENR